MEWTILTSLGSFLVAAIAIIKPIINLTTTIAKNTEAVKYQTSNIHCNEARNEKEHTEMREELSEHDKRIRYCETKEG